jgi:hypothetical protein
MVSFAELKALEPVLIHMYRFAGNWVTEDGNCCVQQAAEETAQKQPGEGMM